MVRELSTGKSKTEEWMFTVYNCNFTHSKFTDEIYIDRNFFVMNLQFDGIWVLNLASGNIYVIPIDELLKKIRLLLLTY